MLGLTILSGCTNVDDFLYVNVPDWLFYTCSAILFGIAIISLIWSELKDIKSSKLK